MSGEQILLGGTTLSEALHHVAELSPKTPIVFPEQQRTLTVAELLSSAGSCARSLVVAGVRRGDVVGLLGPAGAGLLSGLFGIVMAGAAVSVLPTPVFGDARGHVSRLEGIARVARMRHIVVDQRSAELAGRLQEVVPGLRVVSELPGQTTRAELPSPSPDDLAVLQFTSGSTSKPHGVMLSHRTVMAALRAIVISAGFTQADVFVQWVPHHHDMGLFGHLAQILNGVESHVFEPIAFIRHPARFLQYFAACRGTVLTGPNFAYDLLAQVATADLLADLDLSTWRLAFNGAEPVSATTVRRFHEAFGPAGVSPSVMYPVYGMAEATLPIMFPPAGSASRVIAVDRNELGSTGNVRCVDEHHPGAKVLVSVGRPVVDAEVRLVDEAGRKLGSNQLGEVQIKGPMVTSGYLHEPDATSALFDDGWLRTGDLAFQLDGDYYIAGRRKEMVVVGGQNHFPEDAEAIARTAPGVYRQRCVAIAEVDDTGQEFIGIIVETGLDARAGLALAEEIRKDVVRALGVAHVRVHVVAPRWLTRTASGKWQRLLSSRRLQDGTRT